MNKSEAKILLVKYLSPAIENYGYKAKKTGNTDFEFCKTTKTSKDVISGGFANYNPIQKMVYSLSKRHNLIIDILLRLQKSVITLSPPITSHTDIIGVSYQGINNLSYSSYLPDIETEAHMQYCISKMLEFMEGTAFPLLDKFEDLREIDALVNGPDPWITDWEMPFPFGGHFYEKRLIIAKLAGNPNFNFLVDFNYKALEKLSAESGSPFVYDRSDLDKPLPALLKILEEVRPLYQ